MIPASTSLSIACCVAILSSFGISAQQMPPRYKKFNVDSSSIRFVVMDTIEHISFKQDGTIDYFPKDSLTAIRVMYNAMMATMENRKEQNKYAELYFYAAEILKHITKDGLVTNKKKFKQAVEMYKKKEAE